ncbi:MAG: N-acetyltransferase [Rhodospirillales bacterium]|nr:N-acetyltransferase [Rhodospirillales bacterium]
MKDANNRGDLALPRRAGIEISPEAPHDHAEIERLFDKAFGADRHSKAVYQLRANLAPVAELCAVARVDGKLRGAVRFSPVRIGNSATPALLLGPLAVDPELKGAGVGLALMKHTLAAAKAMGHGIVILVGDEPYYARAGFSRQAAQRLTIPGQEDRARVLALELIAGALEGIEGALAPAPDAAVS